MTKIKILWDPGSRQKDVVEGVPTPEGPHFEPLGVPTSVAAKSNPLMVTIRELGPSTECWLWVVGVFSRS